MVTGFLLYLIDVFMRNSYTEKTTSTISIKIKISILLHYLSKVFWFLTIVCGFNSFAQNVTYQTLYTGATFDNRTINQNLPVGSISGAGSVASGGATYSISFSV